MAWQNVCLRSNQQRDDEFIRETKAITLDYVSRITKYSSSKIELWENSDTDKFPTINQAKSIAKCYRVPFAGLYMNANDISIKHLPKVRNLRTLSDTTLDNSALNLAIIDVLSARDLLIDSKIALHENMSPFAIQAVDSEDVNQWAKTIREELELSIDVQYGCQSTRQFYLYVRNAVERAGVFVHCFTGIETEIVRGFAIYEDFLPIIGLNNEDRYPAKTFTIFHELVHLMKRSSAVCNEMISHDLAQHEEVFCNAVAGEILVPKLNLIKQLGSLTTDEIDLNLISKLAAKFSVSKEVISRRLLDIGKISKSQYSALTDAIRISFENEREAIRISRKNSGVKIPRNISREAIDQNSPSLCRTFYNGFREGYFDKQDVARYLGIKQQHVDKFMREVSRW